MEVQFERQALYDEVWRTPLSKLGPQYGLSDNGLRKVCKAMNIPLPAIGHWAKVAAGQKITKPDLPADTPLSTFTSYPPLPQRREYQLPSDQEWLNAQIAFEKRPENIIVVETPPSRLTSQLIATKNHLVSIANKYEQMKKERQASELMRSKMRNPGLDIDAMKWMDLDPGELLILAHESTGIRVSALTYQRALAIANALFLAAKARGCQISIGGDAGWINIQLEEATLYIAIRERQNFKMVDPPYGISLLGLQRQPIPTNKLAIVVNRVPGTTFQLVDGPEQCVEVRLNEVFIRLYRTVVAAREKSREDTAREKRQALYRIEQEKLNRQRAVEAKLKADEVVRKSALLEESSNWHKAEQIKAFVAHVMSHPGVTNPAALNSWSKWAMGVADATDPVPSRIDALNQDDQS